MDHFGRRSTMHKIVLRIVRMQLDYIFVCPCLKLHLSYLITESIDKEIRPPFVQDGGGLDESARAETKFEVP